MKRFLRCLAVLWPLRKLSAISHRLSAIGNRLSVLFRKYKRTQLNSRKQYYNNLTGKIGEKPLGTAFMCADPSKAPALPGLGLAMGIIVLLVTMSICCYAQEQQTVTGKVISAASSQPIAGATITNKRTHIHIITDRLGEYRIPAKPDDVLTYSFVGYVTVEEAVNGREQITVILDSAENMLEEVEVSTGYQTIPKERATGSFIFMDSALINRSVSTDIVSRLKGVTPSLLFDERVGGEPRLSIRGRSTIFANADPLIVVDNFPYEGDLRNINPNDVESISILRDAAAASIWGIRAGNGVIVITTKQGRANQPMQLTFNSNVTVGEKPDLFAIHQLGASDLIEVQTFLYDQGYYNAMLGNENSYPLLPRVVEVLGDNSLSDGERQAMLAAFHTNDIRHDLLNHFYRYALRQQYNLSLQGGGQRYRYYFAAGHDRNRESAVGNSLGRVNISSQHTFSVTPRLELSAGLFVTTNHTHSNSIASSLHQVAPYQRLAGEGGEALAIPYIYNSFLPPAAEATGRLDWRYYPLEELNHVDNLTKQSSYRANTALNYALLHGLRLSANYQYEQQTGINDVLHGLESFTVRNNINRFSVQTPDGVRYVFPEGEMLDRGNELTHAHNGRATLGYDGEWDAHRLNLIAGFEVRESKSRSYQSRYYGYDSSTGGSLPVNLDSLYVQYPQGSRARLPANYGVSGTLERFRSWFFNGGYTLSDRYSLSASARMDQTNLFGVKANLRTVPLWAVGTKWDIDKEGFYDSKWLSRLSLRSTYGYNGNFDRAARAYLTASYVNSALTGLRETIIGSLPNPEQKAERNSVFNIGVDFSAANSRLSGRLEYYYRSGVDLVGNGPIDPTVGKTVFRGNVANMVGNGWDIELNSQNTVGKVRWSTALFVSHTTNKVTRYLIDNVSTAAYFTDASIRQVGITPMEGKPLFAIYSFPWAGLDPETGDPRGYYNGEVVPYQGMPTTGLTFADLNFHGSAIPTYIGSLRNTVSFLGFECSFNLTLKAGYYFRRTGLNYVQLANANSVGHPDYSARWQQPGDERHTHVPSLVYPFVNARDQFYLRSEPLVERGDHLRLQDIQCSYQLPSHLVRPLGIHRLSVYGYVQNLGIVWRANGHNIDPDYLYDPNNGYTTLTPSAMYSFGINCTF